MPGVDFQHIFFLGFYFRQDNRINLEIFHPVYQGC